MTEERTGEAFELGEQLTVLGSKLQVGQDAPDFELDEFDGEAMRTVRLADTGAYVRLISTVNSVDTPVCDVETRRWDQLSDRLPPETVLLTVSMDLPYAQARWREANGHRLLSAHRSEQFGRDYGVLIKEWRLLQRAVFVLDRNGKVSYVEYVADQMTEPDYDRAIEAVHPAT